MPRNRTHLIGTAQAAATLGVSRQAIQQLEKRGALRAVRVGRARAFRSDVVERVAGQRASGAFDRVMKVDRARGVAESRAVDQAIATGRWAPLGVLFRSLRRGGGSR
jgi:excisionase family DNA binding protein